MPATGRNGVLLGHVGTHAGFSFHELDLVALEDEAFAVSSDAGLVFHVNAVGRWVLENLRSGATLHEVSEAIAADGAVSPAQVLTDLTAFTDNIKAGFEASANSPQVKEDLAPPLSDAPQNATYFLFGRCMRVHYPNEKLAAVCHPPMVPYLMPEGSDEPLDVTIQETETQFQVTGGSARVLIKKSRGALMTALQRVILCHDQSDPGLFDVVVHAGAVAGAKGAWLIGGASGRGKSTLVARLDAAGLRVLSDDLVPIDIAAGRAYPLPLALSVKEMGWPVVAGYRPDLNDVSACTSQAGKRVKYIRPLNPATDADRGGLPIAGLLLPQHDPECDPSITQVSLKDAMVSLCDKFGRFPIESAALSGLIEVLDPLPKYQLQYADIDQILSELAEQL